MASLCGEVPPYWKSCWKSQEDLRNMRVNLIYARFMLKIDPACRPGADEVLQHPWFARGEGFAKKKVSHDVNDSLS